MSGIGPTAPFQTLMT